MSPLPYAPPTKKAPPLGYGGKDGAAVGGGEVGLVRGRVVCERFPCLCC
jgi:hypothetical protein